MSSYQIKSTPPLQRMLSRNKKNGELQRLKDEYERIKDFSDYTIALRIRQVRLWRLFRKIQDINAISSARPKPQRKQPKSYEQLRAETLSRARDLGMEFSRENGLNLQRGPVPISRPSLFQINEKPLEESRISATQRRVTYGNVTSFENMRRFQSNRRKYSMQSSHGNTKLQTASSIEVDKVEKLRKCTNYADSSASLIGVKTKIYKGRPVSNSAESSVDSPEQGRDLIKNYTFILDESSTKQSDTVSESVEDQEENLISLWNELKMRIPILKSVPLKELIRTQRRELDTSPRIEEQIEDNGPDESCDSLPESSYEEYELRKIDNDRNLPTSQIRYKGQRTAVPMDDSLEENRITQSEKVIKVSRLNGDETTYYCNVNGSEKEALKSTSSTECAVSSVLVCENRENKVSTHPSLKNKPLTSLDLRAAQNPIVLETQVEDFVKLYEPFPRFHQPENEQTLKDNYESEVVKLRSIFEHQGE